MKPRSPGKPAEIDPQADLPPLPDPEPATRPPVAPRAVPAPGAAGGDVVNPRVRLSATVQFDGNLVTIRYGKDSWRLAEAIHLLLERDAATAERFRLAAGSDGLVFTLEQDAQPGADILINAGELLTQLAGQVDTKAGGSSGVRAVLGRLVGSVRPAAHLTFSAARLDASGMAGPQQEKFKKPPPVVDAPGDEATLAAASFDRVATALATLSAFEVSAAGSPQSALEQVGQLAHEIEEAEKAAVSSALTKVLNAAARSSKAERSRTVLQVVKLAVEKDVEIDRLDLSQDDVCKALQNYLATLKGRELGAKENEAAVALIRPASAAYRLRLTYEDQFVTIRVHPSNTASIQLRHSAAKETPLTTVTWPDLTATKSK